MFCYLSSQIYLLWTLRESLWSCGFSSEVQPLPSDRAGPKSKLPERFSSEASLCWTGESKLSTGDSELSSCVWRGDITTSLLKQQHVVININESSVSLCVFDSVEPASCWVQVFGVSFSKRLHSKPSSALNTLLNTDWFQAGTLSFKLTSFIRYSDWRDAVCRRQTFP